MMEKDHEVQEWPSVQGKIRRPDVIGTEPGLREISYFYRSSVLAGVYKIVSITTALKCA